MHIKQPQSLVSFKNVKGNVLGAHYLCYPGRDAEERKGKTKKKQKNCTKMKKKHKGAGKSEIQPDTMKARTWPNLGASNMATQLNRQGKLYVRLLHWSLKVNPA